MTGFRFVGMPSYIKACHKNYPNLSLGHVGRAGTLEAVTRVGVALSQATLVDPKHRAAVAAEAEAWRDVLALALEGVEAAIREVYAALELPAPQFPRQSRAGDGTGEMEDGKIDPGPQPPGPKPQTPIAEPKPRAKAK